MTTYADLVNSINASLHSYCNTQERVTWLTSAINDTTSTTFAVNNSDGVMRGIAEIDDELVYVYTSDSGGLQLIPNGRGYRGSTATTHAINSTVTIDPVFPRHEIKKAINQAIDGLYPTLYQIKKTTFVFTTAQSGYDMPADCDGILEIKWKVPSPLNDWQRLFQWSFDTNSQDSAGNKLSLYDMVLPGATVQVVYKADFTNFASDSDTFATAGLSESYADLLSFAVTSRMLRFLEPARVQTISVENVSRAQVTQAGDAARVANQLYAMYQQRLSEERKRLLELSPAQMNFQR